MIIVWYHIFKMRLAILGTLFWYLQSEIIICTYIFLLRQLIGVIYNITAYQDVVDSTGVLLACTGLSITCRLAVTNRLTIETGLLVDSTIF